MAFSPCICYFNSSFKIDCSGQTIRSPPSIGKDNKLSFSLKNSYSELFGQRVTRVGADFKSHWSFLRGSRITLIPKRSTFVVRQNASGAYASWLLICSFSTLVRLILPGLCCCLSCSKYGSEASPWINVLLPDKFSGLRVKAAAKVVVALGKLVSLNNLEAIANRVKYLTSLLWLYLIFFEPLVANAYEMMDFGCSPIELGHWGAGGLTNSQIASSVFTAGTLTVLPFYALMVLVPKEKPTKMVMESYVPYIVLGALYASVLRLHWEPDTFRVLYGTKYFIPELPGAAKVLTTDVQIASAWVHILGLDLFAARQVYHDGLENEIQTRHSIFLCLFFGPFGIISHVITKALTERARRIKHGM